MDKDDSPPPLPRMKGSALPEIDEDQPLWGQVPVDGSLPDYSIMSRDSGLGDLTPAELFEINQAAIRDAEQPAEIPLMGYLSELATLKQEYEMGNQTFVRQISYLIQKEGLLGIRRTRGDGDCFYRAFAFAYIERLLKTPETDRFQAVNDTLEFLEVTKTTLQQAGFDPIVYEDPLDMTTSLIKRILGPRDGELELSQRALVDAFNEPYTSNSIMMYMRYLTSAEIRLNPDLYTPYLFNPDSDGPIDAIQFCIEQVESMGKEADHVQIQALTSAIRVKVRVAYLDGHEVRQNSADKGKGKQDPDLEQVQFVEFSPDDDPNTRAFPIAEEQMILLYRPGHYDVLSHSSEDPLEALFLNTKG